MIKTIIFDFGDVFINLDKQGTIQRAKAIFGQDIISEKRNDQNEAVFKINDDYEKGLITTEQFIDFYAQLADDVSRDDMVILWNSLLKEFPKHRLEFIQNLRREGQYQLILLSNTNELHIEFIKQNVPFYQTFKNCFHQFYLSHEIHLRKPEVEIFEFVLRENHLRANECFFIDDTKENTDTAKAMGIQSWNIDERTEDVVNLFETHKQFFGN